MNLRREPPDGISTNTTNFNLFTQVILKLKSEVVFRRFKIFFGLNNKIQKGENGIMTYRIKSS